MKNIITIHYVKNCINDVEKYIKGIFDKNIYVHYGSNLFYGDKPDELYDGYSFYKNNEAYYKRKIHNIFDAEYKKIDNIINKVTNIQDNIQQNKKKTYDDIFRNNIINLFKKYINERKTEIQEMENEAINTCNEDGKCNKDGGIKTIQIQISKDKGRDRIDIVQHTRIPNKKSNKVEKVKNNIFDDSDDE